MREQHGVLGHRIGPGAGPSFCPELSLAIILEAKQGEMEHAVDSLLVPQDVLDEAKSVVAHVGESRPSPSSQLMVWVPHPVLLGHLPVGLLQCAAAIAEGGNLAGADVAIRV